MSQRWNARRKKTLYNCICPYFFSNLNDQNYWMDAGEMIHGSVDTLPHKGHKRMFLINARRSLLAQGLLVIGIALWMIYQYILPALNWCLFDWLEPPNTYITKDAHQKMPWFTCRCFIDYITFDFGYVSRIIVDNRNRFYRNLWFICKYWERLAHKLSGRILKIFFYRGIYCI